MNFFKSIFESPLDKQNLLRKAHESLLQQDALTENENLLVFLPIALKVASMVSIVTTIGYINFTFWGNASIFQILGIFSLAGAILVEIVKSFFYSKLFFGYFSQKLVSRDPKNYKIIADEKLADQSLGTGHDTSFDYSKLAKYAIGSSLIFSLSFYLSINGIKYMEAGFENEINDLAQTNNNANLDSINAIYDNKIGIASQKSEAKIAELKSEIDRVEKSNFVVYQKELVKDLYSPVAKANSKIVLSLQDQISKESDRINDIVSQIENEQKQAINAFVAKFEKQQATIKDREISQIKAKGNDFYVLTYVLEFASIILTIWYASLNYSVSSQQLAFNRNLPTVQNPTILKVDNPITAQVIDLNNQVHELKEILSGGVFLLKNSTQNQNNQNSENQNFQ